MCRTGLWPLPVIPADPEAAEGFWLGFGTGDILRSNAGGCIAGGVELLGGVGGGPCPRGGGSGGGALSLDEGSGCDGTLGGGSLCAAEALGGRAGAWASCCS